MRGLSLRGWCARAATLVVLASAGATAPALTSSAAPSTSWTLVSAGALSTSWSSVAFLGGRWIAVSHAGQFATSTDGSSWVDETVPGGSWGSLAYGDGTYVALSTDDAVPNEMVSSDAVHWTLESGPPGSPQQSGRTPENGQWSSVVFADGLFVAVGADGVIDTSSNGISWTRRFWRPLDDFTSVTYGDGTFVAVDARQGNVLRSSNGTSWSDIFHPLTGALAAPSGGVHYGAVAYGNGNFVAFGDSASGAGYVATSVFGYSWTLHQYAPSEQVGSAAFGCNSFVAAGSTPGASNEILTSPTGQSFTAGSPATAAAPVWTSVAYGAGAFVAVDAAGDIASSRATGCAQSVPFPPQQVSGNVHSGEVWTYMHPSVRAGGAPIEGYRVTISNGQRTYYCRAKIYFQPNCIVTGLTNHGIYWVSAQAYNRFGYSAPTDPEFVIPVADSQLAIAAHPDTTDATPSALELTGIAANAGGYYPVTRVTIHVGSSIMSCEPSPFGECLLSVPRAPAGPVPVYSTYIGWFGHLYRSPTYHIAIPLV